MPLDPGGTQPSVRYVDRHVYHSGPSKTVVTRRERRGNVTYVYRTIYHHYKAPSGTGGGGNPPKASSSPKPKAPKLQGAGNSVLARQRLLRAAGYAVVLDGIWGPRSQSAWKAYQRKRGGLPTTAAKANQEANQLRQLNRKAAAGRALVDAKANASKAKTLTMQHRVQGLKDAQRQSVQPIVRNAPTQLDRRSERFGVVLEEKRRAIAARYLPGTEERIAGQVMRLGTLLADPRTRSRTLSGMSAENLRTYLFDPVFGQYKNFPAQRAADGSILRSEHVAVLQGWLYRHGHKDIRRDGVLDEATLRGMGLEMVKLERRERRQAIADLVDQFYGGSGERFGPGFIREGAAINLLGLPGFKGADAPKPGELLDALQRNDAVSRRLLRELYRRLSVQQLAALRAKFLKADVTAAFEFNASRELVAQMERDANDGGFFGTILDGWDSAVDHTRAAILTGYEVGKEAVVDDKMKFWTSDFWVAEDDISEKALAQIKHFDNEHVYLGLLTQILADPANLIPGKWFVLPFRYTGKAGKGSAAFLESQGYKLSESGRLLALPSKALRAPAETLRLPSKLREGFWAGQLAGTGGVGDDLIAGIIAQSKNATRLLSDTKLAAHMRTTEHLRRGLDADWLPKRAAAAGKTLVARTAPKVPREIAEEFDAAFRNAVAHSHIPAEGLLDDFVNLRVSMYADDSKGVLSDAGAILDANLGMSLRTKAVRDLADERATAAKRALSVRDKRPDKLREEYARVYNETLEGAGPYGYIGDPEIHDILTSRVNFQLKTIRERWFPAIQARVEMALDDAGLSLWNEEGKWAKQEIGDYLRGVGADMFADKNLIELNNPLFGRHFSEKDMLRYAEAEIRMRTTQKEAWYARRRAAGDDPGEAWVEREVETIKDEVKNAWQPTAQGMFTDTRKTIKVSFAYASQYLDLIETMFTGGTIYKAFATQAQATKYRILEGRRVFKDKLTELAVLPGARPEGIQEVKVGGLTQGTEPGRTAVMRLHDYANSGAEPRKLWGDGEDFATVYEVKNGARKGTIVLEREAATEAQRLGMGVEHFPEQGVFPELWVIGSSPARAKYLAEAMRKYRVVAADPDAATLKKIREAREGAERDVKRRVTEKFAKRANKTGVPVDENKLHAAIQAEYGKLVNPPLATPLMRAREEAVLMKGLGWSEEDVALYLAKNYPSVPSEELAVLANLRGTEEVSVLTPNGDPIVPKVEVSTAQLDVNRIASYFKFARDADDVPPNLEFLTEADIDLSNFQKTMERFEKAYDSAYEATQAQALAREGAFYQAMRYSQHAPLRALWKSSEAWLGIWRFLTLPLRPGWAVINHIDNSVKALLNGLVNPKHWFRALDSGDGKFLSVFEMQWDEIRASSRFLDSIAGTRMGSTIDAAFERFWALPRAVHKRVFAAHGFEFPDEMLDAAAMAREGGTFVKRHDELAKLAEAGETVTASQKALASLASFHDRVWTLMGTRPENFTKKALYSSTRDRALKRGATHFDAHVLAWKAVDDTLFDYSKITTLEHNIRIFFPFVQWARKNAQFWAKQAVRRPFLTMNLVEGYSEFRQQVNADLPEWMQRYAGLRWASDLAADVPGLAWLAGPLSEAAVDPVNLFSFKSFYRLVKSENENLPSERDADNLLNSMVEFLEDVGFSMNPLVRKPLEIAGALSLRSWQSVFPQTGLVEAFTRKFWSSRFPNGVNIERMVTDKILTLMGEEPTADHAAANFDTYVQMEMAAQAHRGEPVSRYKAEEKIRDFLLVQTVLGYFGGIYVRHMSPEDIYYSQLSDAMREGSLSFLELSPEERANYRLWKNRFDRVQFDRYLNELPLVRAYYQIDSYVEARKFLRQNPQILPFVEERFGRRNDGLPGYVAEKELQQQTETAIRMFDLIDSAELEPETVKLAEQLLVTKELREYWSLNDTPEEKRIRMLRGQYHRRMNAINKGYHALPEDDFDARKGYLEQHPELQRYWNSNDTESDAIRGVLLATLADLRDTYFEYVEAGNWDGAGAFLEAFPFTFDKLIDGTYTADRETGRPGSGGGGRGGLSAHARDYLANRPFLDHYFSLPESERVAWLNAGSPAALAVKAYFERWGSGGSAFGGADFDSPLLDARNAELAARLRFWRTYWSLTPDKRERYVETHGKEAGIFIYGMLSAREQNDRRQEWLRRAYLTGATPRAAAFLYVKPLLDFFSTLNRKQKQLFVRANPELQWYFDNFVDNSITGNAKLDKLLESYFKLLPGSLDRAQFLQTHPEVQDYFDSKATPEERALRNLLEKYFEITNPDIRREFLTRHPEIREYFEKRKTEREREREVLGVFDDVDPRLDAFQEGAEFEADSVERMLERLNRKTPDRSLSTRRERRPAE
jgi:hypothetical protein